MSQFLAVLTLLAALEVCAPDLRPRARGSRMQRSATRELCRDPSVDAIFNTCDGAVHVFKGDAYYRLGADGWAAGRISDAWPGLPGHIDAAFTHRNGKTFFFKGSQYWRYARAGMDGRYPKRIRNGFSGIPGHLDAALQWGGDGSIYFFRGAQFWRFQPGRRPPVPPHYPQPLALWRGLPTHLDAAIVCRGGTYFFQGRRFYLFNDTAFSVAEADPPYPRPTADTWFGCKGQSAPSPSREDEPAPMTPPTTLRPYTSASPPSPRSTERLAVNEILQLSAGLNGENKITRENRALCEDPAVDTIFNAAGDTAVFKGDQYYLLAAEGGVRPGYPKPISRTWRGLPAGIDAACNFRDGFTYFFKGSHFWRFNGTAKVKGSPKRISDEFPGIPNNIDAAMEWGTNGKVYFFKGNLFWKWDGLLASATYPRLVANWAGIPNYLDAAVVLQGRTYFFKGHKYYRFDDRAFAVDMGYPPYPRPTGEWWFGCPEGSALPPPSAGITHAPHTKSITTPVKVKPQVGNQYGGGTPNSTTTRPTTTTTTTTTTRPTTTTTTTAPTTTTTTSTTTTPATTTTSTTRRPRPAKFDLCQDPKVDTILSAGSAIYVFKGLQYARLGSRGPAPGFPRLIADTWPGLPGHLDAAFSDQRGRVYFFKGAQCWRYSSGRRDRGFPRPISQHFPGVPNSIDTAMRWGANGKTYFFKGMLFWKWDGEHVEEPYPLLVANWAGIPNYLDAALVHGGHTYFFKGDKYYRFHDRTFAVDRGQPPYPRPSKSWWFGCPAETPWNDNYPPLSSHV